ELVVEGGRKVKTRVIERRLWPSYAHEKMFGVDDRGNINTHFYYNRQLLEDEIEVDGIVVVGYKEEPRRPAYYFRIVERDGIKNGDMKSIQLLTAEGNEVTESNADQVAGYAALTGYRSANIPEQFQAVNDNDELRVVSMLKPDGETLKNEFIVNVITDEEVATIAELSPENKVSGKEDYLIEFKGRDSKDRDIRDTYVARLSGLDNLIEEINASGAQFLHKKIEFLKVYMKNLENELKTAEEGTTAKAILRQQQLRIGGILEISENDGFETVKDLNRFLEKLNGDFVIGQRVILSRPDGENNEFKINGSIESIKQDLLETGSIREEHVDILAQKISQAIATIRDDIGAEERIDLTITKSITVHTNDRTHTYTGEYKDGIPQALQDEFPVTYKYRVKEDLLNRDFIFITSDQEANIVINTEFIGQDVRKAYEFSSLGERCEINTNRERVKQEEFFGRLA
ncbi:MAG: hypothetical protein KAR31_08435, partial [Candidatus Omnitrophica bacterium]|nr:hypothetical protein [Candidatus Omnitrophota bacterium]